MDVLDTGHGTGIDPRTLRGVLHDPAAFAAWAGDDPVLRVVGHLFRGELDDAERALDGAGGGFRPRVLRGDLLRDRGRHAEAVALLEAVLAEVAGTAREAVVRQHLGKAHFAAGAYAEARAHFAAALALREAADAPADQLASSRLALTRAEQELAR